MIPVGARSANSAAVRSWGTISLKTSVSRTLRAMSWAYWAPKSTTRMRSVARALPPGVSAMKWWVDPVALFGGAGP